MPEFTNTMLVYSIVSQQTFLVLLDLKACTSLTIIHENLLLSSVDGPVGCTRNKTVRGGENQPELNIG